MSLADCHQHRYTLAGEDRLAAEDRERSAYLDAVCRAEIQAGKAQRAAVVAGMAQTSTERADRLRARRLAAGLCRDCGDHEPMPGKVNCQWCSDRRKQRDAAYRAASIREAA